MADSPHQCASVKATRLAAIPSQAGPKRVLIVDDEASIRNVLADILREEGYGVLTATNGAQALGVLSAHAVDAIVLDLAMPVMNGVVFRREQLLRPKLAAIPVVLLSANHDLLQYCAALRPYACLSKPFALAEVLETLASACALSI
jgi:CheY-like chemotaxis protein